MRSIISRTSTALILVVSLVAVMMMAFPATAQCKNGHLPPPAFGHDVPVAHTGQEPCPEIGYSPDCPADINADGFVDVADLIEVISLWGRCEDGACRADLNADGMIDVLDLIAVVIAWGTC